MSQSSIIILFMITSFGAVWQVRALGEGKLAALPSVERRVQDVWVLMEPAFGVMLVC